MLSTQSVAQTPKTIRPVVEAFGLEIGDPIQNFTAKDIHHQTYSLDDALVNGPVVLIFIRGQWCPFCNKHLSQIQDSLPLIYAKGASVVVISPEKSEFIAKTIEKTGAEFTILYDEDYRISDAFDVTFKPDSITRTMVNMMLGAQLKDSHSDDTERLPIPATYIIN
jgi:peroxiredoxin